MTTLIIIGASGFLGGALARQAAAAGHTVTGTFTTAPGPIPEARMR
ncbi:hypothetical protein [Streptomyces sp. MAR4 CNX-425]